MNVTVNRVWILTENDPDTRAILRIVSVHDTNDAGMTRTGEEVERVMHRLHAFRLTPYDMPVAAPAVKRWEYAETGKLEPPEGGPWEFVQAVVDTWERYKARDGSDREAAIGTTYIWRREVAS